MGGFFEEELKNYLMVGYIPVVLFLLVSCFSVVHCSILEYL